jgi:hypothetical protein
MESNSEVNYQGMEIRVFWGEWTYRFWMNSKGEWTVQISAIPIDCTNKAPFVSLPF